MGYVRGTSCRQQSSQSPSLRVKKSKTQRTAHPNSHTQHTHTQKKAFGLGYDLLALRLQPLAAVCRHVHAEARRTLGFGGPPLRDGRPSAEGTRRRRRGLRRGRAAAGGKEGEEEGEEDEEEEDGQYLARFVERELLDASVSGIQPERVVHHSGASLLATMQALLAHAAMASASAGPGGGSDDPLEAARADEARALYMALARKCASLLGSVWLEAR